MKKSKNKNTPKPKKHLTLEQRKEIEVCLSKGMTFKSIAKLIEKNPTTISYEVKHHRKKERNSFTTSQEPCPLLLKAPFVCNGCKKRHSASCHCVHYYYRAASAQSEYKQVLSESREGIPLNREEFYQADRIITEKLKRGQHLYHILSTSPEITYSKSTIYRHFKKGYLSASRIDLPRAVKFKPRRKKQPDYVPAGVKVGRTYEDFLDYCKLHNIQEHVELDTVIGRIGGKVIMTIHFTSCNFMAGLLMENKTAAEGAACFSALKNKLRNAGISIPGLFPVLLVDNGGEFSDVFSFENDENGNREIPMFFCHPMTPSEKPYIEKNHTLFRDIVQKGSSFDDFTQDTVNLIFSHVNSVCRNKYFGKSAYEMFAFLYGDAVADLFGIKKIPSEEVVQNHKLLDGIVNLYKNQPSTE